MGCGASTQPEETTSSLSSQRQQVAPQGDDRVSQRPAERASAPRLRAGIERQGDAQEAASTMVTNVPEDVLAGTCRLFFPHQEA